MDNFAFIIHPIEPQKDVARKFPLLGKLPTGVIDYFSRFFPPVYLSHIVGIRSEATGKEIEGWLLACPMTPKRMIEVPASVAYNKIIQTGKLAERRGARLLGLGAFTSVAGDAGITVSRALSIPVTTGGSYTVAVAVEASLAAARLMGCEPAHSTGAVVGAYGATGRACSRLLAHRVPKIILVGRQMAKLHEMKDEIESLGTLVTVSTDLSDIHRADIVLTVTSSDRPIIEADYLKPGAVVYDVARPRNVARNVAEQRQDVLVIEGGVVEMPGNVDFGFDFGLPAGRAYACMAETAVLALEGRYENYTIGRDISEDKVEEIARLAVKHGVRLSGLRSFERPVTVEQIETAREKARLAH